MIVVTGGRRGRERRQRQHRRDRPRLAAGPTTSCGHGRRVGGRARGRSATRCSASNFAARQNDGGSGDSVEEHDLRPRRGRPRDSRDRRTRCRRALKRAGIPDANQGAQASATLRALGAARPRRTFASPRRQLKQKPDSPAEAFANARAAGQPPSPARALRRPRGVQAGRGARSGARRRAATAAATAVT